MLQHNAKVDQHIDVVVTKANRTLGFLRCNLRIGATNFEAQAYKPPMQPILEYSCTVWDPVVQKDIDILEAVQHKAVRFAPKSHQKTASVKLLLQKLDWPPKNTTKGQHDLACCIKSTTASQQSSAPS